MAFYGTINVTLSSRKMISNETRKELEIIVKGKSIIGQDDNLATARDFLSGRFSTNTKAERDFNNQSAVKEAQKNCLIHFAEEQDLWFNEELSDNTFLTEGGEAKIHFSKLRNTVIKLNDAIYYADWLDFLNSVLIHNILFNDTAYTLLGFILLDKDLFAVLEQPFIISDGIADLADAKLFLERNGFINTKRNDYFNKELGLILEDIHDENVIVRNNTLFFIDTVFYIHLVED
jgi:hypothetical protein